MTEQEYLLSELFAYADGMHPIRYTETPHVWVETSGEKIRIETKVVFAKSIGLLYDECEKHRLVWVHSISRLPASHDLMMRFAWVD